MKNKGFLVLFICSILLFLTDLGSTMRVDETLLKHLEVNPLYNIGGFALIILFNIAIYWFIYYSYNHKKNTILWRFMWIGFLLVLGIIRVTAIIGNIEVGNDPMSIEEAIEIEQSGVKIEHIKAVYIVLGTTLALLLTTFLLFRQDHKIERKDL